MIDISHERLLPLAEVPKLNLLPLRRQGKRLHLSTIWRWSRYGLRGCRLETLKVGGIRCTS